MRGSPAGQFSEPAQNLLGLQLVVAVWCYWRQPLRKELHMGILDELLGGGQRQKEYRDFVERYEQGDPSEGYSDQEVLKRYSDVSHAVPPNQYAQAAIEALGKLSPEDRAAFVKMLQERAAVAAKQSLLDNGQE